MSSRDVQIFDIVLGKERSTLLNGIAFGIAFAAALVGALLALTLLTDRLAFVTRVFGPPGGFDPGWWYYVWIAVTAPIMIGAVYMAIRYAVRGAGLITTAAIVGGPSLGASFYLRMEGNLESLGGFSEAWAQWFSHVLSAWFLVLSLVLGVYLIGQFLYRYKSDQPQTASMIMIAAVIGTQVVWVASPGGPYLMETVHGLGLWFIGVQVLVEGAIVGLLIGVVLVGMWQVIIFLR